MYTYVLRRLLLMIPAIFGVIVVTFSILHLIPGDPVLWIYREVGADPATAARLREELGLNLPLPVQFVNYLTKLLRGDLGVSAISRLPVSEELFPRLEKTFELSTVSIGIAVGLGITVGILSAVRQYSKLDYVFMTLSMACISTPAFLLGIILIMVFSVELGWLPAAGYGGLNHMILPALALGLRGSARIVRLVRSSMLDVLHQDYIRTSIAKGLSRGAVIYKHALKNAAIPIITWVGVTLTPWLAGTVIVETVFGWPGLGRRIYTAILVRDIPVIQGAVLLMCLVFMLSNLIVDISYAYFDPRIRYK